MRQILFVSILLFSSVAGCRTAKYAALEKVGIEKRDIFKSNMKQTREAQEEVKESFQGALSELRAMYGSSGSKLEKTYDAVSAKYEDASGEAAELTKRVDALNTVARDLFKEWKGELKDFSSPELRDKSEKKLQATQKSYEALYKELMASEKQMNKVLSQYREQVTYLKHNLNAQALQTLSKEKTSIEGDMAKLVRDMNDSISQTEKFIKEFES